MKQPSTIRPERAKELIQSVHKAAGGLDRRLLSVATVNKRATKAIQQATKVTKQLAALMRFDEINRLQEKTVSAGRGGSRSHGHSKVKTGPTALHDIKGRFQLPDRTGFKDAWADLSVETAQFQESAIRFGGGWWTSFTKSLKQAMGNVGDWVKQHLWDPIFGAWSGMGGLVLGIGTTLLNSPLQLWNLFHTGWLSSEKIVGIGNVLVSAASSLWNHFREGWGSRGVSIFNTLASTASGLWSRFRSGWGARTVSIFNSLSNTASNLWAKFRSGWGSRTVQVVNTLQNSAEHLWSQFRRGWVGKVLSLRVSFNPAVSGVKRAVCRALGLNGWPSLSFAARGGVFRNATLTMLGEAGTEAVVPLENNTEWMEVMAGKLQEHMGVSGSITVPVYIGGEKLGEAVVDSINAITRRTGVSPIYI